MATTDTDAYARNVNKRRFGNDDPMSHESRREQYLERPLPSSEESERVILGMVQIDNELMPQVAESLTPEEFYSPLNRRIFAAMLALFQASRPIDAVLISEELKKEGSVEAMGGITAISSLAIGLPHMADLSEYIEIVKDKATIRKLIRACNEISSMALAEEEETRDVLEHAERTIFEICEQPTSTSKPQTIGELAFHDIEQKRELINQGITITGIPTGLKLVDEWTGGWHAPDLTIIAGRPSMGKTALATQFAMRAATDERVVAFFSLEMSKEQLVARVLCTEARVSMFRYRKAFIHEGEWQRIVEAYEFELKNKGLYIDDEPAISPMKMLAKARRIYAERKRLDLIVVDYLQLMSGTGKFDGRTNEVSQISRELKSVAKLLNVPVIALSQLSRAPEARNPPKPIMSDLRESGSIEQDADAVMFVYRDEYYKRDQTPEDEKGKADIIIAKQRNGPTGDIKVMFHKEFTKFETLHTD